MWGPLKDTGKEGFSVRRQAEKQQPVYRLILLCAPNPRRSILWSSPSFFLLGVWPPPPCLTFLAVTSCMGAFHEQKQICLVLRHLLSQNPCLFFLSCLKAEQRGYSEKKNVLSLQFMFCYTLLCILLALYCLSFSLPWQTLNIIVTSTGTFFKFVQVLKDFLACFRASSQWVNCIYSGMEPRARHFRALV